MDNKRFSFVEILKYVGLFFGGLLALFLFVYGSFNFIYDNLRCDYSEVNIFSFGNLSSFVVEDVSYNYIKHVYGVNVSGLYKQEFLIDTSRVKIENCKFRFY